MTTVSSSNEKASLPTVSSSNEKASLPVVVIIGGGFAGLSAAKALANAPVKIILIDRSNHHLFQPLLYQVATAELSPADIAQPIRGILRNQPNVRVILDEVKQINPESREVITEDLTFKYDYLIVAAGARHHYFGNDQWEDHAPGLKSIKDALEIRRRVLLSFEVAEKASNDEERRQALTFVIVGKNGMQCGIFMIFSTKVASICRKGIRINIPEPYIGYFYGNVSEHGDVSRCPRKSSLFFLTILMSLDRRPPPSMPSESNFKRFVEVGRVVLLKSGPSAGNIATIVEIIDQNRAIIDGPTTNVPRQSFPFKHVTLTPFVLTGLPRAAGSGVVKKLLDKEGTVDKWNKSGWAKKRAAVEQRRSLNDFDRFNVLLLKKQRRDVVRKALAKTKA
jgi:large subunit ribosomal protein L14e